MGSVVLLSAIIYLSALAGFTKAINHLIAEPELFYASKLPKYLDPEFWEKTTSAKNKYQGPAILKTFLVFITDGWHLTNFILHRLLILSAALGIFLPFHPLINFTISTLGTLIIFLYIGHLTYQKLK